MIYLLSHKYSRFEKILDQKFDFLEYFRAVRLEVGIRQPT